MSWQRARRTAGRGAALVLAAVLGTLIIAVASFGGGQARAQETPLGGDEGRLGESPPGQVLVLDNNLLEAFRSADVEDTTDVQNFVEHVVEQVPYAPDAILLQEVVGPSAENVAALMGEATGFDYAVVVAPGESAFLGGGVKRETAIVLNADTMQAEDEGGFVRTGVPVPGGNQDAKDQAYVLAKERFGDPRLPLVSVHLDPSNPDKAGAAQQLAAFVDETYPSASKRQLEVIGGDFNSRRCVEREYNMSEPYECEPREFYEVLTDRYGYTDTLLAAGSAEDLRHEGSQRIDYVFARAQALDAAFDFERKFRVGTKEEFGECKALYTDGRGDEATGACATEFYSDHGIAWALVGMSDE